MQKKVLLTATVQSHICQFHKPLMRLLKEHGYEVHVAARYNLDVKDGLSLEYADQVFNIPFDRSPLNIPALIKAKKALDAVLKENEYEVIHCNTPVAGIVTRLAANKYRQKGTKVFYTAHGFHFYKGAPLKNWILYYPIEKFMSRFTDKLITITGEDYQLAKAKFHCPAFHMHGVGANSTKFHAVSNEEKDRLKEEYGFAGKRIILNVGELLPNKNQKTAIFAMKEIVKKYPEAILLIAGNGSEKDNLENLIHSLGMEEHVHLLGYTTSLNKYMSMCDVEIACSYREGLPLNVMEAMLCGKPVVASKNRGHNELIQEGVNGYLVDTEDAIAFSNKVSDILDTKETEWIRQTVATVQPFIDQNVEKELRELYSLVNLD